MDAKVLIWFLLVTGIGGVYFWGGIVMLIVMLVTREAKKKKEVKEKE